MKPGRVGFLITNLHLLLRMKDNYQQQKKYGVNINNNSQSNRASEISRALESTKHKKLQFQYEQKCARKNFGAVSGSPLSTT